MLGFMLMLQAMVVEIQQNSYRRPKWHSLGRGKRQIFVTGKLWPKLYEIKLHPTDGPPDRRMENLCGYDQKQVFITEKVQSITSPTSGFAQEKKGSAHTTLKVFDLSTEKCL